MKKYQLTEDMSQDRKYWMTKIMAGAALHKEMVKKAEKGAHLTDERLLGRMLRQVQVELRARPEARVARRAEERHRALVPPNVLVEDVATVEALIAVVACVERELVQLLVVRHLAHAVRCEVTRVALVLAGQERRVVLRW